MVAKSDVSNTWGRRALALAPYLIVVAGWILLFPGIFSEDSLAAISMVRSGTVAIDWTAIWIYLVWVLTLGGVAPGLATLLLGLMLVGSIDFWMRSTFVRPWRPWLFLLIAATPTVWALGVTLWHDISMTAGLFLLVGLATRVTQGRPLSPAMTWTVLFVGALLTATRINGPVTLVVAGVLLLLVSSRRRQLWVGVVSAAVASGVILVGANATADETSFAKPGIETAGLITDIGCAIQRDGIQLTDEQSREIASYGLGSDWTTGEICRWTDRLYYLGTFDGQKVTSDRLAVASLWWSVLQDHPAELVSARMLRLNSQLPLPLTGVPVALPFIQSIITPNDLGIEWANPNVSELARIPLRAWNAVRIVVANPGLWLTIMLVVLAVFWRRDRELLLPTVLTALSLQVLIFVFSPFSETRYGLFTVIAGYAILGFAVLSAIERRRATRAVPVESGRGQGSLPPA